MIRPPGPPWLARPVATIIKRANGWWGGTVYDENDAPGAFRRPSDPVPPSPEEYLPPPRWVEIAHHIPVVPLLVTATIIALGIAIALGLILVRLVQSLMP
jgi:hypothetical protein